MKPSCDGQEHQVISPETLLYICIRLSCDALFIYEDRYISVESAATSVNETQVVPGGVHEIAFGDRSRRDTGGTGFWTEEEL